MVSKLWRRTHARMPASGSAKSGGSRGDTRARPKLPALDAGRADRVRPCDADSLAGEAVTRSNISMQKFSTTSIPGQTMINAEGFTVRAHVAHPTRSAITRFFEKIQVEQVSALVDSPCWIWIGCRSRNGYGQFKADARRSFTRKIGPHIFAYEYFIGPVPDGFDVHHRCYNRACCSPLHIDVISHRDNMVDGNASTLASVNARKTHCKYGHPLTGDNMQVTSQGSRLCRTCNARRQREFQERRRAIDNAR